MDQDLSKPGGQSKKQEYKKRTAGITNDSKRLLNFYVLLFWIERVTFAIALIGNVLFVSINLHHKASNPVQQPQAADHCDNNTDGSKDAKVQEDKADTRR